MENIIKFEVSKWEVDLKRLFLFLGFVDQTGFLDDAMWRDLTNLRFLEAKAN